MKTRLTLLLAVAAAVVAAACGSSSDKKAASRYLIVANTADSTLGTFTIDQATGSLSSVGTTPAGSGPTGLVMLPDGKTLLVANSDAPTGSWNGNGTVSVFSFAAGALTEAASSPVPAHTMALNAAATPDGRYLYVTNQNDFELTAFSVGAGGALTELAFSPTAEFEAHSIAMHPSGKFFYVGSEEGEIHGHAIGAGGSYTDTPNTPYTTAGAANWLAITPDGKFLYAVNANGSPGLDAYSVNTTTGELTELVDFPMDIGSSTKTVAITPDGSTLYLGLWSSGSVGAYRIDKATGALTEVAGQPFAAGAQPKSITIDAGGRFLYCANLGDASVSAFRIDGASGALTDAGTVTVGTQPKMILAVP